jgi:hypothetical protein
MATVQAYLPGARLDGRTQFLGAFIDRIHHPPTTLYDSPFVNVLHFDDSQQFNI